MEYSGDGVADLSVPERATITNMGAELGATTSIFPSDEHTRLFMKSQGREKYWIPLEADADAEYDSVIDIDLSTLEPMAAKPHSPDAVDTIRNIGPIKVDQVAIGSCTNASYTDLMRVAAILKGKKVHSGTDLVISPGSRQVLEMLPEMGHWRRGLCRGKNFGNYLRAVYRYGASTGHPGISPHLTGISKDAAEQPMQRFT